MKRISKGFISAVTAAVLSLSCCFFSGCADKKSVPHGEVDTAIVLAENGATDYAIVTSAEPTDCERYAAAFLAQYFTEATGAEIAVIQEDAAYSQNDKVIAVGETATKEHLGFSVTSSELNRDGYKIKRFGNAVAIAGVRQVGTLYGVYEFLTRQFGFEPYMADEIHIVRSHEARFLKDFDVSDEPDFPIRAYDASMYSSEEFASMMRNSTVSQSKYGANKSSYAFFGGYSLDNTLYNMLPERTVRSKTKGELTVWGKEHPAWYEYSEVQACLNYEERVEMETGEKMSLDDPDSFTGEYARQVIQLIKEDTHGAYIVSFAQNDGAGYCLCAACEKKRRQANGYESALFIDFANRVMRKVKEDLKNDPEYTGNVDGLYSSVFAYSSAFYAPVIKNAAGELVPVVDWAVPDADNAMYVHFAPLGYCMSHGLFDTSCSISAKYGVEWERWRTVTDRFLIYDYTANYHNYYPFFDNFDARQEQMKKYYKDGLELCGTQSTSHEPVTSFSDLRTYLESKLMWDTTLDSNVLIENFMDNVYKQAAPYMKEYFYLLRANDKATEKRFKSEQKDYHLTPYGECPYRFNTETYGKAVVLQLSDLLDKAYAAFDGMDDTSLRDVLRKRVRKERFCFNYIVLSNYGLYFDISAPDYAAAVAEYEADAAEFGAQYYREYASIQDFIDSLKQKIA